jgi:hypothetical protein
MKKYIFATLFVVSIVYCNAGYSQTTRNKKSTKSDVAGCPSDKPKRHMHHPLHKKPIPVMHEDTITVDNHLPITVVQINRGNVTVNDSFVAKVVNPKYENYRIVINNILPQMNVSNTNTFTGNKPERPRLGVYTSSCCDEGAIIEDIVPCGPADKAGLRPGYLITGINDTKVKNRSGLIDALSNCKDGDKITVTYLHYGDEKTTDAFLIAKDKEENCGCNVEAYQCCRMEYPRCCRW